MTSIFGKRSSLKGVCTNYHSRPYLLWQLVLIALGIPTGILLVALGILCFNTGV